MTDRKVRAAVVLSAAPITLALLGPTSPSAGAVPAAFRVWSVSTPSGNIRCIAVRDGARWSLRCDTGRRAWQPPARDCGEFGDNAGSVEMTRRKPSRFICVSDAVDRGRTLKYGQVWTKGPFTCTSRRTGLTCTNLGGHGWRLSRESYRLF